jgi:hypothetical protein
VGAAASASGVNDQYIDLGPGGDSSGDWKSQIQPRIADLVDGPGHPAGLAACVPPVTLPNHYAKCPPPSDFSATSRGAMISEALWLKNRCEQPNTFRALRATADHPSRRWNQPRQRHHRGVSARQSR